LDREMADNKLNSLIEAAAIAERHTAAAEATC
jgi:hypothetical protein